LAARTDPRRLAVLLVLLAVAAIYGVTRLRLGAIRSDSDATRIPDVGSFKVPSLGWDRTGERAIPTPGGGRNLFTFGPPPTPTPDRRPTPTPMPTQPPRPTVPRPTPTPAWIGCDGKPLPPPPSFTMSFVGWIGPERLPVAIFKGGEEILAAARGDKIKDKFVIHEITIGDKESFVLVGFVCYPETVTTKVSLAR